MDSEDGQSAAGGATGGSVQQSIEIPTTTDKAALAALAGMFQTFLQYQKERDERQERDLTRREQQFKVLTHQVTQMQMDLERTRYGATSAERSATRGPALVPRLPKLQEDDDIEQYLTTFERMAEVYLWPKEDWAVHLIPLLTGKARSAFVAMSPALSLDYDRVKEVILKKYEISPETYRLRFRSLDTPADESPMELYVRLKDLFSKWVRLETSSKMGLMETLVLEQYMRVLYPEVRTWVKERNPVTAEEAASLVEAYSTARKGSSGTFRYAGSLQSNRGKSVGSGGSSYSQLQTQILKPTHPKPIPPVVARQSSAKNDVVCYNCAEPGHTSPHCPLRKPKSARLCYIPTPTIAPKVNK